MDHLSTWDELINVNLAFLPIGATEQHGRHLPLATDGIIADALASELSKRFEPSYKVPLLPYSASFEHADYPGFVSLRTQTLTALVTDIVDSLKRSGIFRIVLVNGHGGNHLLRNIVQELNIDGPHVLLVPSRRHWEEAYQTAGITASVSQDMHAGEGETSLLMHLMPHAVKKGEWEDHDSPDRPLLETLGMKAYTHNGTIGFPTRATAEKGAVLFQALIDRITTTVKEFVNLGKK